jgi:hypothetical protein
MNRYAVIAAAALFASGSAGPGIAASPKPGEMARNSVPMMTQYDCKDIHEDELGRVETTTYITGVEEGERLSARSFMKWSMPVRSEGIYLSAEQLADADGALEEPRTIDIHFATGPAGKKAARIELQRLSAARNECCSNSGEIMFASPFLRPRRPSPASGYEIIAPAQLTELRMLMGQSELLVTLVLEGSGRREIVARDKITSAMLARPMQAFTAAHARAKARVSDYRTSCEKKTFPDEPIIVAARGESAREYARRDL